MYFKILKLIIFIFSDYFDIKNNFLKIKNIILKNFKIKNILNYNYYHPREHPSSL